MRGAQIRVQFDVQSAHRAVETTPRTLRPAVPEPVYAGTGPSHALGADRSTNLLISACEVSGDAAVRTAGHADRMASNERILYRATRRGESTLKRLGEEFRHARLEADMSQQAIGRIVHMSGSKVSRLEAGSLASLSVVDAARVSTALGLDLAVRTYPGGRRPRDAAQARRLHELLGYVRPPLRYKTEVPLPRTDVREQRAWDSKVFGAGETTAIELETRLYDIQGQTRRLFLKQQDDPPDHLLLVVADTHANRAVLRAYPELFAELPRLKTSRVLALLAAGRHPPTGIVLL